MVIRWIRRHLCSFLSFHLSVLQNAFDTLGFQVGVYRMSNEQIGCSLADAAASPRYTQFLETASRSPPSLHVIYINTSLETKAYGHELVPTITCTSSNVVQTILQVCNSCIVSHVFSHCLVCSRFLFSIQLENIKV